MTTFTAEDPADGRAKRWRCGPAIEREMIWEVLDEMSRDPRFINGFERYHLQTETIARLRFHLYHAISYVLQEAVRAGLLRTTPSPVRRRSYTYHFTRPPCS